MGKLQLVQNSAVRAVKKKFKSDEISEARESLHWLPMEARCKYKLLLLTWKCQHDMAPDYLKELIIKRPEGRSVNNHLLYTPKTRHVTHGDLAFGKLGPTLWNELPHDVKSIQTLNKFKKHLKTYLFTLYKGKTHLTRMEQEIL